MSKKIMIIDYSLGNMFSVEQALKQCGANTFISNRVSEIKDADAIVLPGVGAFGEAMDYLKNNGIDTAIKESINSGKQFFGICLGMQLLFEKSAEFGSTNGLGIIKGDIRKFRAQEPGKKLHVPQMGWNTIVETNNNKWAGTALSEVGSNAYMYFVHSYYAVPTNEKDILCQTNYGGINYCSAVIKDNVFATQFHPEKSGEKGLTIYKNWLKKI